MRLFIFDMGGVVVKNCSILPDLAKLYGKDVSFFLADNLKVLYNKIMAGEITEEEFWNEFSKVSGLPNKGNLWGKYFKPTLNEGTVKIIKKLKENYRVVCGTNTLEAHYNIHLKNNDYCEFQKVYASHVIGKVKPNKDFYEYILNAENETPSETVFVDDFVENIESARGLGINAIHFKSSEQLEEELKEYLK